MLVLILATAAFGSVVDPEEVDDFEPQPAATARSDTQTGATTLLRFLPFISELLVACCSQAERSKASFTHEIAPRQKSLRAFLKTRSLQTMWHCLERQICHVSLTEH